ncbi:hypothetical protein chiPu_0005712 [Chiloscyllium punctatum]|uniref:Uncharacterized protein n=1 Tax=Chiloscyllium punctatum TaxID=137246 RepID=A0A401SA63_CHIPU|nr:hypothetical protein [Chiloscyllium punctatum]
MLQLELVYLVTGFAPLDTACLTSSPGQQQANDGLDFPGADGVTFVVYGQATSLSRDALENVIEEWVHDAHGLGGDAIVGVNLFHHFMDVNE